VRVGGLVILASFRRADPGGTALLLYPFNIVDECGFQERSLLNKSRVVACKDFEEFSLPSQPTWIFSLC